MNDKCIYNSVCGMVASNDCNANCLRYIETDYLLKSSNIPEYLQKPINLYPDNVDYESFLSLREIKDTITDKINAGNFNLYLYSSHTGNGKTSWAVKMMLRYFSDIWAGNGLRPRGLFISVPDLLYRLKDFNTVDEKLKEWQQLIPKVDLIIWDDIASTKMSDYDCSRLLQFLESRMGKSNIFTANADRGTLFQTVGNRLASRIWLNSVRIELKGRDKRGGNDD